MLLVAMSLAGHSQADNKVKVFNVRDFGAMGDSLNFDTKSIQKAIDACYASQGGIVRVPAGNYPMGTIRLKSNVTLSLDYGAVLLGSQDIADYDTDLIPAREGNVHCLIYAENSSNIRIEGLGVIDGRGTREKWPRKGGPRPRLVRMESCEQLTFSGVTYKRPAFWGLHLVDCKNIDVRNCIVSSNTATIKFGTSSSGGFINVTVSNCYFYDSPMGAIKLELVDGGRLENVDISRIVMENVSNPIFIRLGDRGKIFTAGSIDSTSPLPPKAPVGSIRNIRISEVVARVSGEDKSRSGPIMITGIPGHYVEDVVLENITISFPGGGTEEDSKNVIAEDIDRYPEQFFFGVLPAWGAYIRHAKDIRFHNVKLSKRDSDKREMIVLDDVERFIKD